MKKICTLLFYIILTTIVYAQNVGIGTNNPDNSALLHLEATDMGLLLPRMNTAQRDAIVNPAIGLSIYNTQDSTIQYWNGVCWLAVYQESCNDCMFTLTANSMQDTIDRVIADSVAIQITVNQTSGNPGIIPFGVINGLPSGMTYTFSNNPLNGSGTTTFTVYVTPFTPAGTYPIIIQALCGNTVRTLVYTVTIEPCYIININNSATNYNLANAVYATYPNAPTNQPICVLATVQSGVTISSNNTNQPAFTTGNLPAGSLVAIVNNGNIIGRGGNGGTAYSPTAGTTGAGFSGGNAINLTVDATIENNFNIYGGGGGGSAMAFEISWTPPAPANFVTLGIFIGGGGGGGAGGGLGGNAPAAVIGLVYYSPGVNGTAGQFGVGGAGGVLNFPIPVNLGPVSISLNPDAVGGDGGGYGYPGTQGYFSLTVSASVVINIPFVGPVTVPVVNNVPLPTPVPPPPPGNGGYAIKRNGYNTNIPDNFYNTSFLKGQVGP
ncbi:MAG: hypothetical protein N2167_05785 [Flavobacteriales bacterium]|nr:hypothetical protein [Flavobacteriales bacterium]